MLSSLGIGLDISYGNLGGGCQHAITVLSSVTTICSSLYGLGPELDSTALDWENVRVNWETGDVLILDISDNIIICNDIGIVLLLY